jgi:hypothetical protein
MRRRRCAITRSEGRADPSGAGNRIDIARRCCGVPVRRGGSRAAAGSAVAIRVAMAACTAARFAAVAATGAAATTATTSGAGFAAMTAAAVFARTAAATSTTASAATTFSATATATSLCDQAMQRLVIKQNRRRCGQCRTSQERKDDLTEAT